MSDHIHKSWNCINDNMIPKALHETMDHVSLKRKFNHLLFFHFFLNSIFFYSHCVIFTEHQTASNSALAPIPIPPVTNQPIPSTSNTTHQEIPLTNNNTDALENSLDNNVNDDNVNSPQNGKL